MVTCMSSVRCKKQKQVKRDMRTMISRYTTYDNGRSRYLQEHAHYFCKINRRPIPVPLRDYSTGHYITIRVVVI